MRIASSGEPPSGAANEKLAEPMTKRNKTRMTTDYRTTFMVFPFPLGIKESMLNRP
jgi:hypothetical protein